jgi:hypothetical protein
VQLVKQEFFADNNLVFSGLAQDPDGNIHVCTSKDSYPENQNGVAIRNMMINGDLKDKIDLKLDMIQNIAPTAEGGFLVLFNFDMFDDAKGLRMAYSNSQEYYMSERDYGNMPGVMKISKYGSLDWVVELSYAEYFSDDDESSIIALPDNHFWIIFNYSAEDTTSEFGAQNDFTRIVLVNGNGNKLLEKDFIENEYGLLHAPVLLEDGRVLMFSDFNFSDGSRSLVWLDRQGNMTKGTLIDGLVGMSSHQIAAAGDNGFIYTGREEEKDYMALVDQSGKVIWKNPTQDIIHVLAADEHGILSLSTEKYMYAYEQTGSVLYTLTRYSFDGSVKNVMNFTTETPVDFKKMITTDYSVVLAGNLKRGDKKGVTVLVTVPAENADIFRNMNSYTYMEYSKAVEDGNTERIRTLAAFGIDPDFRPGSQGDRETETDNPLLLAFKSGKYDLAEELLKAGADPDAVDNVPVRYFIYEKPEIYNLPLTPLMYVALTPDFYDAPKYVELLHRYHADFKRITRNGTAFRQAFQMQNTAFMDLYIKYEPFTTDDLNNMFISTFENDLPSSLQWLLDHGANPNAMDFLGDTYMDKGMQSESKEIKAVLKEFGKTNKK